jgi:membrane associated rhomboid family serine protease
MGPFRYALYYLAWGLAAAAAQIYVDPFTSVPNLGASGAIGGVLGAYFLLFPGNKVELFVPLLAFLAFEVSAWVMLGIWFLWQIFAPQEGVANWAHAGGFLAGMTTVLIMGGRANVLKGRRLEYYT